MRQKREAIPDDSLVKQLETIGNPVDRRVCELYLKVGPTSACRMLQLEGGPVLWPPNITRMARKHGLPTSEVGRPSKVQQYGPLIKFMEGCGRSVSEIARTLSVSERTVYRARAV